MKFYKDSTTGKWILGTRQGIPAGTCLYDYNEADALISVTFGDNRTPFAKLPYSQFTKENGTTYASKAEFDLATADFFENEASNATDTANIATIATVKGSVIVAHNAIIATATSATISTAGFNGVLVSALVTGTGTWNVNIQGKITSDGTFMDMYDNNGNQLTIGNTSTSLIKLFGAIPDFIQVVATEIADGATLTVKVQPIKI